MEKINLFDYICPRPFTNLEVYSEEYRSCCAEWLTHDRIYDVEDDTWNGEIYTKLRQSILDGSYKYCQLCPYLDMMYIPEKKNERIFKLKSELTGHLKNLIDDFTSENKIGGPETLILNVDNSCNFRCKSCRTELIIKTKEDHDLVDEKILKIEKFLSENVKDLCISTACDPFASKMIRKYLRNFDPSKYKKLERIDIITNGSLLNEKMWNSMPNIHPYVKSCSISVDAGTKYTYENLVRINGNWETLIENLKFINTIETIERIKSHFVIQKCNYMEIIPFTEKMYEIFGDRIDLSFTNIVNWGTFTDDEFNEIDVSNTSHPEFENLKNEMKKLLKYDNINVYHTLSTKVY